MEHKISQHQKHAQHQNCARIQRRKIENGGQRRIAQYRQQRHGSDHRAPLPVQRAADFKEHQQPHRAKDGGGHGIQPIVGEGEHYGKGLEQYWGTTRFNLFYFTGAIATLIIGLITGYASNIYLDGSIFLAFAILYPDFSLYILFFIPIKVKWIALLTVILDILAFLLGGWLIRIVLLVAYANVFLFFWGDIVWHFRRITRNAAIRKQRQESRDRWNRK